MIFQELIREANKKGIVLTDWDTWNVYRIYSGTTGYAYKEEKANEI